MAGIVGIAFVILGNKPEDDDEEPQQNDKYRYGQRIEFFGRIPRFADFTFSEGHKFDASFADRRPVFVVAQMGSHYVADDTGSVGIGDCPFQPASYLYGNIHISAHPGLQKYQYTVVLLTAHSPLVGKEKGVPGNIVVVQVGNGDDAYLVGCAIVEIHQHRLQGIGAGGRKRRSEIVHQPGRHLGIRKVISHRRPARKRGGDDRNKYCYP